MRKLILISDKDCSNLTCRLARKFFRLDGIYIQSGSVAIDFIKINRPDYVFIDVNAQDSYSDLTTTLNAFDSDHRFRVHLFSLSFFKSILFKIVPFQFIDLILQNILQSQPAK